MWVQAYHFGKTNFVLGVGGESQETSRNFKGGFGSMRAMLLMFALKANNGAKIELKEIKLSYCHYSICS